MNKIKDIKQSMTFYDISMVKYHKKRDDRCHLFFTVRLATENLH
jgi:hypothetical protein